MVDRIHLDFNHSPLDGGVGYPALEIVVNDHCAFARVRVHQVEIALNDCSLEPVRKLFPAGVS